MTVIRKQYVKEAGDSLFSGNEHPVIRFCFDPLPGIVTVEYLAAPVTDRSHGKSDNRRGKQDCALER